MWTSNVASTTQVTDAHHDIDTFMDSNPNASASKRCRRDQPVMDMMAELASEEKKKGSPGSGIPAPPSHGPLAHGRLGVYMPITDTLEALTSLCASSACPSAGWGGDPFAEDGLPAWSGWRPAHAFATMGGGGETLRLAGREDVEAKVRALKPVGGAELIRSVTQAKQTDEWDIPGGWEWAVKKDITRVTQDFKCMEYVPFTEYREARVGGFTLEEHPTIDEVMDTCYVPPAEYRNAREQFRAERLPPPYLPPSYGSRTHGRLEVCVVYVDDVMLSVEICPYTNFIVSQYLTVSRALAVDELLPQLPANMPGARRHPPFAATPQVNDLTLPEVLFDPTMLSRHHALSAGG